jgi:hypothetical protein
VNTDQLVHELETQAGPEPDRGKAWLSTMQHVRRRRRTTRLVAGLATLSLVAGGAVVVSRVLSTSNSTPSVVSGEPAMTEPTGPQATTPASESPPDQTPPQCAPATPDEAETVPCEISNGLLQLTERELVAEGDVGADHWRIFAFESTNGACYELRTDGFGSHCGEPHGELSVSMSTSSVNGVSGPTWMSGFVRKDVAQIRLEFTDGQIRTITPVGQSSDFRYNFYVTVVPLGTGTGPAPGWISALDEQGNEIARYPF